MKIINRYNLRFLALAMLMSVFVVGCSDENVMDPTADFTYEVDSENPLLVSFEATATNGKTLSWEFGDGGLSIAKSADYTFPSAGTYSVKLTVYGEEGSTPAVVTKSVTVIENPTAKFTATIEDLTVMFTSTTTASESFSWDFGDGQTSTEENPVHTYTDYGTYTVSLTVNGMEGSTPAMVSKDIMVEFNAPVFEAVVVENSDFELPGDSKYTNWANVPGWSSDTGAVDSGVEASAWWMSSDNSDYAGYKFSGDAPVYNLTNHIISEGEEFLLTVDAFDIWNGAKFTVTLYYNNGDGVRNVIETQTVDLVSSQWNPIELSASATAESVGARLGIEINTAAADGGDGWTGFDDIVLMAK
ncbi:PKD domain-containing protein [Aestuariibaculum lutulentum]|uniref:PKD domain-containing protein n=1 Tax=Aestuariibaculum lutulentum TaxID=2920935 RepID=UPI002729FE25|nr:PKD domain-containing protein [Aestuariibaculum lutulentum]